MTDKTIRRRFFLLFIAGGFTVILLLTLSNSVIRYTSTNEFCGACHVHPHAETTWRMSAHNSTRTGVTIRCVDCHLPPEEQSIRFLVQKSYHGIHDFYGYLTLDHDKIDWEAKRTVEASKRFVYEDGCKKCHVNLFPVTLNELGAEAHLKYLREPGSTSCVKCHQNAGHYRGETNLSAGIVSADITREIFNEPATVTSFTDYQEQIPGTSVSFIMKAIPGGRFQMGSPADQKYRDLDEGPVREVEVDSFWMAEVEVTWDEYLAFFNATSSQGRKEAEVSEVNEEVDGISGATPPWGAPDQGWGMGSRPAITMSHHAAMTYCRWISQVTGKNYRLPTEAEWEYAARAGTAGPYFFGGTPSDYSSDGILKKIFGADTAVISRYVIYQGNSPYRTQPPSEVLPNPFGLKNMLGNVAEFCLDYYDAQVYAKYPQGVVRNPRGPRDGLEHVVRGGAYKDGAADLRVADRDFTKTEAWLVTDPQIPKSIWWYSDAKHVGFRIICPYDPTMFNKENKN